MQCAAPSVEVKWPRKGMEYEKMAVGGREECSEGNIYVYIYILAKVNGTMIVLGIGGGAVRRMV